MADKNHSHSARILYSQPGLQVSEYQCRGIDTSARHDELTSTFDIILPRSGLFVTQLGKIRFATNVNHITFLNPDQPYRVTHPVSGGDISTVISIEKDILRQLLFRSDADGSFASGKPRMPHNQIPASAKMALRHRVMIHMLNDRYAGSLDHEAMVLQLCADIFGQTDSIPRPTRNAACLATETYYRDRVEYVKVLIHERHRQKLCLTELSRLACMSPFHLSRIFAQHVGIPVHKYVKQIRLHGALEELSGGQTNLTALALDYGFSSHSHFAYAFQAEFGCSPSRVRAAISLPCKSKIARI